MRYVRSDSVVSRVIAGETLIVPIRRGVGDLASIYSLNEIATAIWSAIAEPRSKPEIVQGIEAEFDTAGVEIEADVTAFLREMHSAGLVNELGDAA